MRNPYTNFFLIFKNFLINFFNMFFWVFNNFKNSSSISSPAVTNRLITKDTPLDVQLHIILYQVYLFACEDYKKFMKLTTIQSLGMQKSFFDFFNFFTPESQTKLAKLEHLTTPDASFKYSMEHIEKYGSLYDPRKGEKHSFNNFFLTSLFKYDTNSYRKLVGSIYGIVFLSDDEVTLYRRDTRDYHIIFKCGFQLKSSENKASTRKYFYSEPWTFSYGISTSYTIPNKCYGPLGYFTIQFKKGNRFLLIDIIETAKLRKRLNERRNVKNVKEVNCLQDIPGESIRCFTSEGFFFNRVKPNPQFTDTLVQPCSKSYGVY